MGVEGLGDPETPASEGAAAECDTDAVTSPSDGTAVEPCPCDQSKAFSAEGQANIDKINELLDTKIADNQRRYDNRIADYEKKGWPTANEPWFAERQARIDALKQQKEDFNAAINECACYGDDLLTLANVVYNEAGAHSMTAKTAVAYAYLNRTGGVVREPEGNAEISHYKSIDTRISNLKDGDEFTFIPNFTESIKAACKRLRDQDPAANDPTNGATHWVSPDALPTPQDGKCGADRYQRDGHCFPTWTDKEWEPNVVEMQAEGVSSGEFLFYKGVRY